ncbi:MAG: VOC family protein [Pseudomonadota bacterium]|nr:VOC family protein [Pseudomonadota bacterium]
MAKFVRIDHIAIHVGNLNISKSFYETHFGFHTYFQHQTSNGINIAYLRLNDTVLELTELEDGAVNGFHFCLECEGFEEAIEKLCKTGLKVVQAPHKTAARSARERNWQRVVFEGPDGEQIEVRG